MPPAEPDSPLGRAKPYTNVVNVTAVISAGLSTYGYSGLFIPGVCGCLIEDLSPGSCLSEQCQAGYKHTHSQRPDEWMVSGKKNGVTDADIEQCIADCG